jgi:hypothetical protein
MVHHHRCIPNFKNVSTQTRLAVMGRVHRVLPRPGFGSLKNLIDRVRLQHILISRARARIQIQQVLDPKGSDQASDTSKRFCMCYPNYGHAQVKR